MMLCIYSIGMLRAYFESAVNYYGSTVKALNSK